MSGFTERGNARDGVGAGLILPGSLQEHVDAPFFTFDVICVDRYGREKWREAFRNLVVTVGKNDLLDKYFAGSGYTAAWYIGLIGSTGYSAIAAGDTMASHAGWTESTVYSNANRPTLAFSAASGGSKATSAAAAFTINGTDTIKGAFVTTVNTKGGTTGILYSAGLFTGGDKAVASADTLNVSGSWSV
jgi:hypothetical protein